MTVFCLKIVFSSTVVLYMLKAAFLLGRHWSVAHETIRLTWHANVYLSFQKCHLSPCTWRRKKGKNGEMFFFWRRRTLYMLFTLICFISDGGFQHSHQFCQVYIVFFLLLLSLSILRLSSSIRLLDLLFFSFFFGKESCIKIHSLLFKLSTAEDCSHNYSKCM